MESVSAGFGGGEDAATAGGEAAAEEATAIADVASTGLAFTLVSCTGEGGERASVGESCGVAVVGRCATGTAIGGGAGALLGIVLPDIAECTK